MSTSTTVKKLPPKISGLEAYAGRFAPQFSRPHNMTTNNVWKGGVAQEPPAEMPVLNRNGWSSIFVGYEGAQKRKMEQTSAPSFNRSLGG